MSRADEVIQACADALYTAAEAALPEDTAPIDVATRAWQAIWKILDCTLLVEQEGRAPR